MRPFNAPKDFLTNCYTREGIYPFLKKMEEDFLSYKKPFSVLIMDVDHFKSFNDKYGHLHGDEVLKYFSSSMRLDLEDEENAPFRFGGDEFIMIFPNKTANEAYALGNRLRKNISTRSCLIKGKQLSVTFSGGIASYPADARTCDDIMEKADKALYYSKNHGRGRITKFSDLAKNEFLYIGIIILTLTALAAMLYTIREPLSSHVAPFMNRLTPLIQPKASEKIKQASASLPETLNSLNIITSTDATYQQIPPQPIEPPITAIKPNERAQSDDMCEIYLNNGRVLKARIKNENEEALFIELGLQEGKGILQIRKSQVIRIDRGRKSISSTPD